jgi:hypothetical protein
MRKKELKGEKMETKPNCEEKNTPCDYRQEGRCTFWEKAELFSGAFDVVAPDDDSLEPLLEIDTYREPCLLAAEKLRACSQSINPVLLEKLKEILFQKNS